MVLGIVIYKAPNCCWYWKQVCKVKTELKRYYSEQLLKNMPRMSISSTYQRMIGLSNVVHWDQLVWNRLSIPKYRMICWLVMHQRLRTLDLLVMLGVLEENKCLLGADGEESHNHLFFQCSYSV